MKFFNSKSARLYCRCLCFFLLALFLILSAFSCQKTRKKENQSSDYEIVDKAPEVDSAKKEIVNNPAPIKYDYHWTESKNIPPVAIVIDDFGQIGGDLLQGFAELDENITFSILPDLPNTAKSAQLANVYGHEVLLHIPMEALDKSQNPGKIYIKSGENAEDIKNAMNHFFDQVPQAVGANNHMGSSATSDYQVMSFVLKELDKKGLFFLDSKTSAQSVALAAARDNGIGYVARDIFLDVPDVSPATINAKLASLEKYKGREEPVIIISHCHNKAKLEAMRTFVSQLKVMGMRLIPVSEAVGKFQLPA